MVLFHSAGGVNSVSTAAPMLGLAISNVREWADDASRGLTFVEEHRLPPLSPWKGT
jgi:hypothetical protein